MENLFAAFLFMMMADAGVDTCKILGEMEVNNETVYHALCETKGGGWGEYFYLERDGNVLVTKIGSGERI